MVDLRRMRAAALSIVPTGSITDLAVWPSWPASSS